MNIALSLSYSGCMPNVPDYNRFLADPGTVPYASPAVEQKHIDVYFAALCRKIRAEGQHRIVYGGDLRVGGITREIITQSDPCPLPQSQRGEKKPFLIINSEAFPISDEISEFASKNEALMDYVRTDAANLQKTEESENAPDLFARLEMHMSLMNMRRCIEDVSDVLVVAGGKMTGYAGLLPGILAEMCLFAQQEKPIVLIPGFGGAADFFLRTICLPSFADHSLPEMSQIDHLLNRGSKEFRFARRYSKNNGMSCHRSFLEDMQETLVRLCQTGRLIIFEPYDPGRLIDNVMDRLLSTIKIAPILKGKTFIAYRDFFYFS